MPKPANLAAVVLPLLLLATQSVRSETIADRLAWPPVFERSFGTPKVTVREADVDSPKLTFIRPLRQVIISAKGTCSRAQIDYHLRHYFLCLVWNKYLAEGALTENEVRMNMGEMIPLSRATYYKIGHCRLSGRCVGNPAQDAWWNVRMGKELTESRDYLMGICTLEWDSEKRETFGHFSFCLRKRGGCPDRDMVFDFRAPWFEDRRPRFTEAPNIHNELKLKGLRENMYDWLYTQTEYRNSHAHFRFVNISREQACLLLAHGGEAHEAGNFRVFKKNCASLGTQFLNRLLPLDEKIPGEDTFADFPLKAAEAAIEQFGGAVEEVRIENRTQEHGREPTSKSKLHRAKPSRLSSRPFKILKTVAKIN